MKTKKVKQFAVLSAIFFAMALVFVTASCKMEPEVKYVTKVVQKYVNGIEKAGNYNVYHYQQKTTGGDAVADYDLVSEDTEVDKEVAAGATIESLKKTYTGFTAVSMAQNGSAIYIFYDRNTITYTFNTGDGGRFTDGSVSKKVSGLYGTTFNKPLIRELESYDEGYKFQKWTLADGSLVPSTFGAEDINDIIAVWREASSIPDVPEDFVYVPGGTVTGGTDYASSDNDYIFVAGRTVTIGDMYVCDHEVTQKEYETYCSYTGSNSPYSYYGDGDSYPAYYVSWYDALVYCNKRSLAEGLTPCYTISGSTDPDVWGTVPTSENSTWNAAICDFNADGYRLPTEAEWEYIAREAGTSTKTYSGSDTIDDVAWYWNNSGSKTHEVMTKAANSLGIYDMSGNVWEWCWDWYGSVSNSTPDTVICTQKR